MEYIAASGQVGGREVNSMNRSSDRSERSPADLVFFGLVFFGIVIALAGFITTTPPGAITGLALALLGVLYFVVLGDW